MRVFRWGPLLVVLVLLSASAPAAVHYLAPNGRKENPGTKEAPWRSLQDALWRMKAGDTLLVRGGRYSDTAWADLAEPSTGKITTIRAYPGEKPVFDGRLTADEALVGPWIDNGDGTWRNRLRPARRGIDGLWVNGHYYRAAEAPEIPRSGTWHRSKETGEIRVRFLAGVTMRTARLEFRREALITFATPYWHIEGIVASHYHRYGIGVWRTQHVAIHKCQADHNGGAGIEATEAAHLRLVENQTSHNGVAGGPSWAAGVHLFASRRIEVRDHMAYGNGGRGLDIVESSNVFAHHNTFVDNARDSAQLWPGELSLAGEASLRGLKLRCNRLLARRQAPPLVLWNGLDPRRVDSDLNRYVNRDIADSAVGLYGDRLDRLSLAQWIERSGQDRHSVGNEDPSGELPDACAKLR